MKHWISFPSKILGRSTKKSTQIYGEVAKTYTNIASILSKQGDVAGAVKYFQLALQIQKCTSPDSQADAESFVTALQCILKSHRTA